MLAWVAVIAGIGVAVMAAAGGVVSFACAAVRSGNNVTPDLIRATPNLVK
ncbi:MAG TPA: hypothetical protein VFF14_00910 [Candidatus Deferrimicrobium sp.]|jgi:hypothetical protein|nr:hypothetical protein [Candidatus Deferrimicrobium sp.]